MSGRTISANDILADLVRAHQLQLQRLSVGLQRKAMKVLTALAKEMSASVVAIMPDQPLHWNRYKNSWQLAKLLEEGREAANVRFTAYGDDLTTDMRGLAVYEAERALRELNKAANIGFTLGSPLSDKHIEAIVRDTWISGGTLSAWLADRRETFVRAFADEVQKGMVAGESNTKIARRILGYTGRNGIHHPGIAEGTARGVMALVRTATNSIANEARMELYRENENLIKGYQHLATLDGRTTFECASRDSLVWDFDYQPVGHDFEFRRPPLHWGCRSTMIAILKSWEELGIPMDDIPAGTRASMDGQVSAALSFEEWLESKGEDFQREYLGPGRYKLYKTGQISFSDLVNQNGRPLTLKELRALGD